MNGNVLGMSKLAQAVVGASASIGILEERFGGNFLSTVSCCGDEVTLVDDCGT